MLKPSDQAKLLKDAGAVQEFLETDTIVQRNNAKLASKQQMKFLNQLKLEQKDYQKVTFHQAIK